MSEVYMCHNNDENYLNNKCAGKRVVLIIAYTQTAIISKLWYATFVLNKISFTAA